MSKKIIPVISFALVLFIALRVSLLGVGDPFVGTYNANNNYLMLSARNFARFGFAALSFLPTYYAGEFLPETVPHYLHHPPFIFWLAHFFHRIFGFGNWVTHLVHYVFFLGTAVVLYFLVRPVWGKEVAFWSALSALVLPLSGTLWKVQYFEQVTLFFTVMSLWALVGYLKNRRTGYLVVFGALIFVNALSDWYAGYLAFALPVFFLPGEKNRMKQVTAVYALCLFLGLGLFLFAVYRVQGGFSELVSAISVRSVASELTGLNYWPLRLAAVTFTRILIYLTPLFIPAAVIFFRTGLSSPLQIRLAAAFLVLGSVNPVFLPTAAWGHTYFLYYFIPLGAVIFGAALARLARKNIFAFLIFLSLFVVSGLWVAVLKNYQQGKQVWKYHLAQAVVPLLVPYETVAVANFPGDVLENYFFHPTVPVPPQYPESRFQSGSPRVFLLACGAGECLREPDFKDYLTGYEIRPYRFGENRAWLIAKTAGAEGRLFETEFKESGTVSGNRYIIELYRALREKIGGIQI